MMENAVTQLKCYVFADTICTKKFEKQIQDLRNVNSKLIERELVSHYASLTRSCQ